MADIYKLFRDAVFDPEELQLMGSVFDLVKAELPEVDPHDIAAAILRHAQQIGALDGPTLTTRTLEDLGAARLARRG